MTNGGLSMWVPNLPTMLLADRCTAKQQTKQTPFYLNHGAEAVLPIELEIPTWRILDWDSVKTTSDLLAMRANQITRRDDDLVEAARRLQRRRTTAEDWWEAHKRTRAKKIPQGALVLLFDQTKDIDMSKKNKLRYRWKGPFRVTKSDKKGYYFLKELDGTPLEGTFVGNSIKPFYKRQDMYETDDELEDESEDEQEPESDAADDAIGQGTSNFSGGVEGILRNPDSESESENEEEDDDIGPAFRTRGSSQRKDHEERMDRKRALIPEGLQYAVVLNEALEVSKES
ncbi:hypothetical protein BP5796_12872 [Coleophoma crateriformis]|uniref:Uncharacterized protein n=1 Tax=Coleophoma crateriformis TaxID=565419 RepID=A0A3D8Q4P2_9HELO|nr:hypothetical protein BP5796_12872 [Coleophoma crateriformis]